MKSFGLLLTVLIINVSASAQVDSFNQFDTNGKKVGWWIVYLDKDLKTVEDSSEATYYRYTLFDGKFNY